MGQDKKSKRPEENKAVFTTIVGGRPPGSGTKIGAVPHAVEVLVKKASVDPEFRKVLLEKRGEAAREIDLELTQDEQNMLASIPREQLEKIIDNTKVRPEHRDIFLGNVGKLMVAAAVTVGVIGVMVPSLGHTSKFAQEQRIRQKQMEQSGDVNDVNEPNEVDVDSKEADKSQASQTEPDE